MLLVVSVRHIRIDTAPYRPGATRHLPLVPCEHPPIGYSHLVNVSCGDVTSFPPSQIHSVEIEAVIATNNAISGKYLK